MSNTEPIELLPLCRIVAKATLKEYCIVDGCYGIELDDLIHEAYISCREILPHDAVITASRDSVASRARRACVRYIDRATGFSQMTLYATPDGEGGVRKRRRRQVPYTDLGMTPMFEREGNNE